MEFSRGPGWMISAVVHGALLAGLFVALPNAQKFTDAQETVPVQFITEEQFNQVVKGRKDARENKPLPPQAAVRAPKPEPRPEPPVNEAKRDVPSPPPPLKRRPDPGKDDAPAPRQAATQAAPQRPQSQPDPAPAPLPPERPKQLAKLEPEPKPEPKPEAEPVEKAEPVVPLPPRRPRNLPKRVVKRQAAKPTPLLPEKKKEDRIAKLLKSEKTARANPRSGRRSDEQKRKFDSGAIARLLSRERPQRSAATGRQVQRQARLGSPTASAAKMSPSMWGQLDGLMQEQYKRCWSFLGLDSGKRYVPQIRLAFTVSGRLAMRPILLNPPADPALKPLAASAMRAVRKCDPLRIPARFAPFHDEWKARILRFDPREMLG